MRAYPVLCLSCLAGALALSSACSTTTPAAESTDAGTVDAGPTPADDGGADASACAPPPDFDVAVPAGAPAHASAVGHVAMALDDAGSPRIAFIAYDPNADGDGSDTALYFIAYDGATCTWKAPVLVDTTGDVDSTRDREVTLARDPSNGRLAIGYQAVARLSTTSSEVMLAQSSDDGATWTKEQIARDTANQNTTDTTVSRPTVAMKNGKTFFAYYETWLLAGSASNGSDANGFHLLSRTGATGAFTATIVPPVASATLPGADGDVPALAIDDAGNAGFAYIAHVDDDTANLRVCYFASNQPSAVAVLDSEGTQNDATGLALVFEGNKPRIAASLQRGSADETAMWFSASDDGATWAAPVQIPKDGGDGMGSNIAMAADGHGQLSIATENSGGTGDHTCGSPKLATGDLTKFTTCGAALAPANQDSFSGPYVQLAYAPNGKRVMAFADTGTVASVAVWREP